MPAPYRVAAPGHYVHAAAPRARAGYENYWSIFLAVLALYAACTIGLHFFMLVEWWDDFLETRWLAYGDDPLPLLTSTVVVLLLAHFTAISRRVASDFFVTLLAAIPIMPMIALYANRGASPGFLAATLGCFLLIWLGVRIPLPPMRLKAIEILDADMLPKVAIGAAVLFLLASVVAGNLEYINFNFAEVYDFRAEATETRGAALGYLATNVTGLLLPLALAISLDRKMWRTVALLFFINLLIFGFTSHKSYFFIPLFATTIFFVARRRNANSLFLLIAAGLIVLATAIYQVGLGDGVATITVRRIFFVPAYANYLFYDFFAEMPKLLWSDNRITFGFVNNPYGVVASRVIMNYYGSGDFTNLLDKYSTGNTGFLGAGFAEGGYIGMFLYATIITVLLRCSNLLASKIGRVATCAGLGHLFGTIVFASTDTLTTFATYGVGLFVMLAFVIKEVPAAATAVAPNGPARNKGAPHAPDGVR